ncbi:kinase-like domain-containing protein [Aspergillus crustosus]
MTAHPAVTAEKSQWIGGGLDASIYRLTPTIVVKTVRCDRTPEEEAAEHPFVKEIAFFKYLNECPDRCASIIECFRGRLITVKEYEDFVLIARWIQQLTSALAYVEKMGFCHNDLHASNCLLDENSNLKLADFGRATTIGQLLEGVLPPRAKPIRAGPLKSTYELCSARTEQFTVETLLYFMVYGHDRTDDITLSAAEWDRRFGAMEFPELTRHEVFDGLISACWYNVYPTMALLAYDVKRKTNNMASDAEFIRSGSAKEAKSCEALIRRGLLGPELAFKFQPAWRRYLHMFFERSISVWKYFVQKDWSWS